MLFTSLLNQIGEGRSEISISSDWMQGRAAYGGLVAALVLESMRKTLGGDVPVRCVQVSFVGPVSASAFVIESEVLRQGKSVSQVMGRGTQGGETKIVVQASFGHHRDSAISVEAASHQLETAPEDCQKLPYTEGLVPAFTQHFDFRYATPFPFGGSQVDYLQGHVRFAQAEPEIRETHLLGLIDAWPPTTLPKLKQLAMASSLSWTVEFIQPMPSLAPDEYTQYESHIVQSANGYGHTRAKVWNSAGELVAISQQTVTHFA